MPIPFIIGAGAVALGLLGFGAAASASEKNERATSVQNNADQRLEDAKKNLDTAREKTETVAKRLGLRKLEVMSDMERFVSALKQIKNFSTFQPTASGGIQISISEIQKMEQDAFSAKEVLGVGGKAVTTGVLTGIALTGGVSSFAAASTGTAIAGLSGAAATNATLAWLGGGSLATGGLGITGGMAVLGGVIAGPALLVFGAFADSKAEKNLTRATQYSAQIDILIEQAEAAQGMLLQIRKRAEEIEKTLNIIYARMLPLLLRVENIIEEKKSGKMSFFKKLIRRDPLSIKNWTDDERYAFVAMIAFGKAIDTLLRIEIVDEEGYVTEESLDSLTEAKSLLARG